MSTKAAFVLLSASVVLALSVVTAVAADGPQQIVARAKGLMPGKDVVGFVAAHALPSRFTAAQRPNWKLVGVRVIAEELCGALEDGYIDSVNARNHRSDLTAETVPGAAVWDIAWPACLSVAQNISYTIKPGDSFTSIRLELTGEFIVDSGIKDYFANSGVAYRDKNKLPVGTVLKLPFRTLKTLLTLDATTPADFATGAGRHVWVDQTPTIGGKVVGVVEASDTSKDSDVHCVPGGDSYPFDAAQVAYVYNFVTGKTGKQALTVNIVDNGFLGVPCAPTMCPMQVGTELQYADRFPADIFPPAQYYGDGPSDFVGPLLPLTHIDPLNYRNGISSDDIDETSGHGTYVAGLAIGGPRFESYRATTIEAAPMKATVELSILPIAKGTLDLPAGADQSIQSYLHMLQQPSIVNLSVEFDDQVAQGVEQSLRDTLGDYKQTLFVAAAGNESADLDNGRYFPAALGGPRAANLITVASIDGDGKISSFSNWGAQTTDLAAPGCRIVSWLDADNDPVPLSGTSAAAPVVSFAAALVRSAWQFSSPHAVKNRLVFSGDLIPDPVSRKQVSSLAVLNIVQALLYNWDLVTVREESGVPTEYLGSLDPFSGFSCPNVVTDWRTLKSLKRDGAYAYIYQAKGGGVQVCSGDFANTVSGTANMLSFRPYYKLIDAVPYVVRVPDGTIMSIPAQCVDSVVRAEVAPPTGAATAASPVAVSCPAIGH